MSDTTVHPQPLWWANASFDAPPASGDFEVDVLVVGGGITGLTLAWTLLEKNATVAVLESGAIAGAASGRNAGFLMAAPAEPYNEQVAIWGRPGAKAVLDIGRRSHRRIRQLAETLSIDCEYRPSGSLRLTRDAEEADEIRASLPLLAADGYNMDEIGLDAALPESARKGFTAAFLTAEDGELHPVRFLHGLASAIAQAGGRVHPSSPVRHARWQDRLWEVHLDQAVARARTLVLCTNAYAPLLCPILDRVIQPRRGQVIATAPLERMIAPRPSYAHYGYQYWRQTRDGRLVIGGWRDLDPDTEIGYEERTTDKIQHAIEHGLKELVPEPVAIEWRWAGIMGFARDGRPLAGWLDAEHHLAICAGFTGHGLGMAAGTTEELAELLSFKAAPGIATFDPSRFPELRESPKGGLVALGA